MSNQPNPSVASRRAKVDALVIAVVAVVALLVAIRLDLFGVVVEFVEQHESWELDEILLVLLGTGLAGFAFALRRLQDLRREVVRRTEAENEVSRLAFADALTGLPNRRTLQARLSDLIERKGGSSTGFVILALDLDNFKYVNDVRGHAAGDSLLVEVGRRLQQILGENDFAARIGGDEFIVVSTSAKNTTDSARLARRVSVALSRPIDLSDGLLEVGVSIGVAMYPDDAETVTDLLRRADMALYRAKQEGRGETRFFEPSMDGMIQERIRLETALRQAIRDKAIDVHFQPLVDLDGNRLIGFEALARWNDPELGVVSPTEFIQIAEDTALIMQLSDQLLEKACRAAAEWPQHVLLSFNISPLQLKDRSLGLRIMKILGDTRVRPDRLVIEITESAFVKDFEAAQRVLQDLRATGVRVALDDFGTGYSSLAQLSHFRFDKIKIDRSFIEGAMQSTDKATLIRAILSIGQGLGLETTAKASRRPNSWRSFATKVAISGKATISAKQSAPKRPPLWRPTSARWPDAPSGRPYLDFAAAQPVNALRPDDGCRRARCC